MPLPNLENLGFAFFRAIQSFVKDVEEFLEMIIDKLKETFGELT